MNATASLDRGTILAIDRTRLAHERTLMAWVRTATSLISFAFTIYKFFQYLQDSQLAAAPHGAFGPRGFALAMIALGVGTLVLATIQHHRDLKVLEQQYGRLPRSTAMIVAAAVASLGIVVLTLVVFRQ